MSLDVFVEIGNKKAFAGAVDWPGWCRAGRNEESALQALFDARPRGGALWTPRFFTRRAAWHMLDHAWKIEDRST